MIPDISSNQLETNSIITNDDCQFAIDELNNDQLIAYFSNLGDINLLDNLIIYYNKNRFNNNIQLLNLLMEFIFSSVNSPPEFQNLLTTLFIEISEGNTVLSQYLIDNNYIQNCCQFFPSHFSFIILQNLCEFSKDMAIIAIENSLVTRCNELFTPNTNFYLDIILFLGSFSNYFDLYSNLYPTYTTFVNFVMNPDNYEFLRKFDKITYSLEVISKFCYNIDFSKYFFTHKNISTFIQFLNQHEFTTFMYLVQISFSETKYNTTKVDEFKVVHNSGILAKILNINFFNSIVYAACKAILSSTDDLLIEYSIKALESISLYQNSAVIIFENNVIEKLLQMLNENISFETKVSITNLLCNLIYISYDLANFLKDNGFYDYITSSFENIIVQSGKHILNALIKSIEYIEFDNSFEECVRNENITNILSLIAYGEEYSEIEDEFGNLLSELASTLLDLLDPPEN